MHFGLISIIDRRWVSLGGVAILILAQKRLTDERADEFKGRENTREPLSAKFATGDTGGGV